MERMQCNFDSLESENVSLTNCVEEMEADNFRLSEQVTALEKTLEKQKSFHRKFVDDVVESERIRNEDFKSQKRSLTQTNKSLIDQNRQLNKDVSFYKGAYEELVKEENSVETTSSNQRPAKKRLMSSEMEDNPSQSKRFSTRLAVTSTQALSSTISTIIQGQADNKRMSSKKLSKISEKIFSENKKLKLKVNNLSATILLLKKKIRKLESNDEKTTKQKSKVERQVDELTLLVDSTKIKNKNTFNAEVLAKLNTFSE